MGGGDKCLLSLGGRPLLAHVIERLRPQVLDLIISANGDPTRFSIFGLPVVEDRLGDYAGPLAGVHAGLEWARTHRPNCRYVITAASDTPFLPANLVSRLRAVIDEEKPKPIVARSEAGLHPVFGLWPVALAADLEDSLRTGAGKVSDWVGNVTQKRWCFRRSKPVAETSTPSSTSTGRTSWLRPKRFSGQVPPNPGMTQG